MKSSYSKIRSLLFFAFFLCSLFAISQPANDACGGAITVPQNGTCVTGTTVGAADNWIGTVGCQSGNHVEVWYTFVATGSQASFAITNGTMTGNIELILVAATGPCAGLGLQGSTCGASPLNTVINGLQVGTTYYFTISSSTSSQGTFTSCLTVTTPPPVSGQDCSTAAVLCTNAPFTQASSSAGFGAQEVSPSNSCWGAGGERQSKWFKFTVGCSGTLEFMISPVNTSPTQAGDDYDWAIWQNCPGAATAPLACNWSGCMGTTGLATNPAASFGSVGGTNWENDNPAGPGTCSPGPFQWSNTIAVTAGNTYALLIDNYTTSNSGFSFQFGGTAHIGPDATFTMAISNCGLTVTPTKTCATSNSTYLWSYGDGTTSTLATPPAHTYAVGGSYIVSLTVTDALGCSDAYSLTVNAPTANANVDQTICAGSTVTLAGSIGGSAISGTWSGGGGTFTPSATTLGATYTPTAANIAAGTVTLTLTPSDASGSCPLSADQMIITITAPAVATFSYTGSPYCQNAANPSPTFSGGGVAGTFSSTVGLVFVSTATGQVNLSASTPGTYTVTNTIPASAPCGVVTATSTITITALPVATFSYTGTPYCKNAANPSPTFSGGGVAGTFSSTAGLVFVSTSTGQVNLAASTAGTYTVTNTVAAAGGCPAVVATSTITITAQPVATFSYTGTPYCQSAANPSPTFSGGGVAGTFSSTAGLVFVSTATGVVNLSASTPGTYTVTNTIAAAGGCPAVTATSTITITAQPVATFSYTGTPYCQNAANPSPTFSGGGVAGTFSSTAGLVFVSTATGQVNLSASTPGTYTVTNTIAAAGGCPVVTATSTITITAVPVATFSYTGTPYCKNAANPSPTFSGGGIAGTFSSTAGLVFVSTATGQVNLAASTAGTYTVTNTIAAAGGCAAVVATATITITPLPVATFSYTGTPYCHNAANPSPTFSGGGVAGTFSSTAGLVFVSTATGQVNLSASTNGTYTVTNTIAAASGCPAVTATTTITIQMDNASFSYASSTYCQTGANPTPTITGLAGGTFSSTAGLVFVSTSTGQINLSGSSLGSYVVTYTTNGSCPNTATFNVTITTAPSAAFSYAGPYCQGGANPSPTFPVGSSAGTFSSTAGLVFVSTSTGQVNLSTSTPGTYTVTNTIAAAGGCAAASSTASITITPLAVATFSYTGSPYCQNAANPSPTFSGGGVAGTFSSTAGLVFVSIATGQVNLSGSTPGTYTVTNTIPATGGCTAVVATSSITITALPAGTFSYTGTPYCQNAANPSPTFSGGGIAGTFSSTAGLVFVSTATGQVNLSGSTPGTYTVTNTIAAAGGCAAVIATSTITITAQPVATFSYTGSPYCQNAANPSPTFSGGGVAGTFSSTAGLVFVSTATGQVNLSGSTPGTYTVTNTIAAAGGCPIVTATSTITITAQPVATFSYTGTPYCQNAANPSPTFSGGGIAGTFSSTAGLVFVSTATGQVDLLGSTPGTYTVTNTIAAAGGCPVVTATSTITITAQPVATFSYTGTPYCQNAANPSPTFSGGGVAGIFSSTAGLVFVSTATGQVNLSASTIGTYTVTNTIAAAGGCPLVTATSTITITPLPIATFSYAGTPYCQNAANPSPTFSGGGVAGTFSSTAGLVFVSTATGQIDLAGSTAGTYTVTNTFAAAGGCPAVTATASITVTPMQSSAFTYASSTYCQSGVDPTPTITGTAGGTFTSLPGGLSINASTGTITLATSSVNTYTVTYTTAGPCAASGTFSVTITTAPSAAFSYAGPYCQAGSPDPSPSFGAGASAGVFTSGAGLAFVSTSTGQVDIASSIPGTYTVTNTIAAASGCAAAVAIASITIDAAATASSGGDDAMCAPGTYSLAGAIGGGASSLTWTSPTAGIFSNPNSATSTYTPSAADILAGSVTLTITTDDPAGPCPAAASSLILTISPEATTTAGPDASVCSGNSYTLAGSIGGSATSLTWSSPTGGTFSNANSATSSYTPSAADISAGSVTLTITTDDPAGICAPATDDVVLTINPTDNAAFSYTGGTFCQSGTDPTPVISGTPGGVFSSTAGITLNSSTGTITLLSSTLGTYIVIYTTGGICPDTSSVTITITNAPSAAFSYAGPYCQNAGTDPLPSFVAGSSGGVFSSTPGLTINASTGQITLASSTPGTYTVTNDIAAAGGCAASTATSTVEIDSAATVNAGADDTICAGSTFTTTGTMGGSASSSSWSTSGTGTFAGAIYTPSAADILAGSVTLTMASNDPAGACGAGSDAMTLTINALPNVDAGPVQTLACSTSSAALSGSSTTPGATFSWSGAGIIAGGSSSTAVVNVAGVYTLTVSAGGCSNTDTVSVFSNTAAPNADAGTPTSLTCTVLSTTLNGSSTTPSVTYSWTGAGIVSGGGTATPTVNAAGVYTITVTDPSNGCSSTDTVSVLNNAIPPNANAGSVQTITCTSATVLLNGSSGTTGVTYSWSGGVIVSGGSTQTPTVSAAGVYTITVTNPINGCITTDTTSVLNNTTPPNANAGSIQTITCTSPTVILNGSSTTAGVTYSWAGVGIVSGSTTATPTVNAAGTYTLTVTNPANGCTATSTVVVSGSTVAPVADAGTLQNVGCGILTATLDGSGSSSGVNFTYAWTTLGGNIVSGGTTTAPVVDQGGVYTITVTNTTNGCTATDTVSVISAPTPVASFSASPVTGAPPLVVSFSNSSTSSNTYVWDFGDGTTSTGTSPGDVYNAPGTYLVVLIASFNSQCPDTAEATIIVYDNFTLVIPNIFTPNGDGSNDTFQMTSTGVADFKGEIYDRWGLKMLEMNNIGTAWDGRTTSGVIAPDGTYYYIFNVKGQDGSEHIYKGFIQLIR